MVVIKLMSQIWVGKKKEEDEKEESENNRVKLIYIRFYISENETMWKIYILKFFARIKQ